MSWEMVKLGDILDYEQPTKYIVSSDLYDDNFKTPVLTAGKSFILGYTNETDGVFSDLPVIIFDDFTTVSKYVDFPFKVKSSAMKILRAKESVADTRFMFYLLQTLNVDSEQHKRYWISTFAPLSIPLPPLPIQKRIAEILDAADALKRKDQELLKKYDELAQAIFIEMFGDPVKNEKGWEVKKLGELGTWKSGGTPLRSNLEFYKGDIPWLSSGELNDIFISESKEYINKIAINNSATSLIEKDSLLLGMYDTAALKSSINKVQLCCNQAIAFSKLDDKICNTLYVYYYIQVNKDELKKEQRGVRQKNMNLSMIKELEINFPSKKEQDKFAKLFEEILIQKNLIPENNLFQTLIQKAFKGELVQ